ncbi:hypothetical protein V8E54_009651 [Elaphomyces granulatus]
MVWRARKLAGHSNRDLYDLDHEYRKPNFSLLFKCSAEPWLNSVTITQIASLTHLKMSEFTENSTVNEGIRAENVLVETTGAQLEVATAVGTRMKRTLKVYAWNVSLMELSLEFREEVMRGYDKDSSPTTGASQYSSPGYGTYMERYKVNNILAGMLIPGPKKPKVLDTFLRPLVDELLQPGNASTVEYLTNMDTKKATSQVKRLQVSNLRFGGRPYGTANGRFRASTPTVHSPPTVLSQSLVLSPQSSTAHGETGNAVRPYTERASYAFARGDHTTFRGNNNNGENGGGAIALVLDLHKVTHRDLESFDMLCIVPIEETRDTILVDWEVEWLLEVSDCQ